MPTIRNVFVGHCDVNAGLAGLYGAALRAHSFERCHKHNENTQFPAMRFLRSFIYGQTYYYDQSIQPPRAQSLGNNIIYIRHKHIYFFRSLCIAYTLSTNL